MSAPCLASRRAINSSAAGVASTRVITFIARSRKKDGPNALASGPRRSRSRRTRSLEEPKRFGAVRDQQILGLLVMIEHLAMVFATDTGLLVTAERGMRRIEVIAVGPHPTRLDLASHAITGVCIARPHAGA